MANHTYHHPDMPQISTREEFQEELAAVEELYHSITGTEMVRYYRPPQGKYNVQNLEMA